MRTLCTYCHDASCRVVLARARWYDALRAPRSPRRNAETQLAASVFVAAEDECRARTKVGAR